MSFASIEVIQFSLVDIVSGLNGNLPILNVGVTLYAILSVGTLLKLALFIYCRYVNVVLKSDMLEALAEDHFNDVPFNSAAIVTATIAYNTAVRVSPLFIGSFLSSILFVFTAYKKCSPSNIPSLPYLLSFPYCIPFIPPFPLFLPFLRPSFPSASRRGAILISLVIIVRWACIMSEQVKKIVGDTAPPDFIIKVHDGGEG